MSNEIRNFILQLKQNPDTKKLMIQKYTYDLVEKYGVWKIIKDDYWIDYYFDNVKNYKSFIEIDRDKKLIDYIYLEISYNDLIEEAKKTIDLTNLDEEELLDTLEETFYEVESLYQAQIDNSDFEKIALNFINNNVVYGKFDLEKINEYIFDVSVREYLDYLDNHIDLSNVNNYQDLKRELEKELSFIEKHNSYSNFYSPSEFEKFKNYINEMMVVDDLEKFVKNLKDLESDFEVWFYEIKESINNLTLENQKLQEDYEPNI